jgi:LysR family carnitine catabolism transcriptional activator
VNVTLRQLRAFLAVAEAGHFTRAAAFLGLSQSSVSTLVRELEENLELRLFDRHTRMLRLTDAGAEILPLARKAVADLDSVVGSSRAIATVRRGRVSVAASSVQAALLMPRFIRLFVEDHPGVQVVLRDAAQHEVPDLVRSGEVDFGLGTASASTHDLATQVFASETFCALLPPEHPLQRKRELAWRDLVPLPLIGPAAGNPLREQLDFALARENIALVRRYEVQLPLTIVGMVAGGLGVGVVTTAVGRFAETLGVAVKKLTAPVVTHEISLIQHPERSLSPAAQALRDRMLAARAASGRKP